MDGLQKIITTNENEQEFSFKSLFVPLTATKAITLIIFVGFIVYFNVLFNGFAWDDGGQLTGNAYVQGKDYFYYFTHTIGPYYKPLMFFFYTLIFQLFNLNSFVYHLFQVALHILNAIILFLVLRQFSKKTIITLILSLFFLIHPMNEETIAYVADYQDVLFMVFGLASLLIISRQSFGKYSNIVTAVLLLLSMFSKETGILFTIICILYISLFKKTAAVKTIIYCALSFIVYISVRFLLVGIVKPYAFTVIPHNTIIAASLTERLISIPKIIYFYLSNFFVPTDLSIQYWYVKSFSFFDVILPAIIDICFFGTLIFLGVYLNRKKLALAKSYWFFFIWFCLGLSIHLQIIPLDVTAADRWFYFPMIGLLGMFLFLLNVTSIKLTSSQKNLVLLAVIGIMITFALRTIERNPNWHDSVTYFRHELTSYPSKENIVDIQYNYGTGLLEEYQYKEASIHLQKATELSPESYQIWQNLGLAYINMHEYGKAKYAYTRAVSIQDNIDQLHRAIIYIYLLNKINIKKLKIWEKSI
ncbi:MAG: hypothetical protein ACREHC_04640 [Candidatus Levyibacteriota bacterium]